MTSRALGTILLVCACEADRLPEQQFYNEHIQPIFNNFCVGNTSPCHKNTDGVALGNLDLSSFEGVQKRRDVLRTYGSYPQPLLLLKALPESAVPIPYQGRLLQSEILHAGNKPIAANTEAFYDLKRWLDNGANRDGVLPVPTHRTGSGSCATTVPTTGVVADAAAAVDPSWP